MTPSRRNFIKYSRNFQLLLFQKRTYSKDPLENRLITYEHGRYTAIPLVIHSGHFLIVFLQFMQKRI